MTIPPSVGNRIVAAVMSRLLRRVLPVLFLSVMVMTPARALAVSGWFDASCRRPVDVIWNADNASGAELCQVEFYTAGHINPDGSDIRVATEAGRQTPGQVINIGPGDRVTVIFALVKGEKKYYVYFSNPRPTPDKPAMAEVKIQTGLLMETHVWAGQPVDNFEQVETAWNKAGPLLGRTMIDSPFLGINPFGPQEQTISRITGSLFLPLGGTYTFSIFADDRGALYIDGQRTLFATLGPADASIQKRIDLSRGRHDFLFYHVNTGGDGRFTVAWARPDTRGFEAIPRPAFGIYSRGIPGALEELHKTLVADFSIAYEGECFYADAYSHRYKFSVENAKVTAQTQYAWDFGDGQTAAGADVEHVFLTDGVYTVKLTVRIGGNSDTITQRLKVERDWAHIDKPPGDEPPAQSMIVGKYDVATMPVDWLARATLLHERAGQTQWMMAAAQRTASSPRHGSAEQARLALSAAAEAAEAKIDAKAAAGLWAAVPPASDLQPVAAREFANLLVWRLGDFHKAVQVLTPFTAGGDPPLRRLLGDALILDQKAADGEAMLRSLDPPEDAGHKAARSGAMARTIEFHLSTRDFESGEAEWERWQNQYPSDFLQGYSAVLQSRLIELHGSATAAAAVAEAFAKAVPGSSYAPQLLHRAATLVQPTDAAHSAELIKLLKERYPEDPLSQ